MTPEGKIKKKLDTMLKQYGVWYFCPQSGPYGVAGIPDRVAIVRGQFIGIEAKADESKKLTALQQKCARDIQKAGGKHFVVNNAASISIVEDFIRHDNH